MRTTIDVSEALILRAKELARNRSTTFKSVLESALRQYLDSTDREPGFRLPDCSVSGEGLAEGASEGSWERISELIYEGRGQ